MTSELVRFNAVSKSYGRRPPALASISLSIANGEHTLILGENGAGKTTFLEILLGTIAPTAGNVVWTRSVARLPIGYAPERTVFIPYLSVAELLRLAADSDHVATIDALRLGALTERYPKTLSKGEAQRLSLALALAPGHDVVVLDEPFEGLDPLTRPIVRAALNDYVVRVPGCTVIATTHRGEEIRSPFKRLLLFGAGRVARDMSVAQFEEGLRSVYLEAEEQSVADVVRRFGEANIRGLRAARVSSREEVLIGPFSAPTEGGGKWVQLTQEALLEFLLSEDISGAEP